MGMKTEVVEKAYVPTSVAGEVLGTAKHTTTYSDLLNLGKILMMIAGSDGDITEKELDYFYGYARGLNAPPEMFEEWKRFDWSNGDIEHCVSRLSTFATTWRRRLIYMAIKVSSADGQYDTAEQAQIHRLGELFRVAPIYIKTIEHLVCVENTLSSLRYSLFGSEVMDKPDVDGVVYEATTQNRELLGEAYLSHDDLLNIGKILLIVAGADGELSRDEFEYFVGFCKGMGATRSVIKEWKDFDWRNGDIDACIAGLSHFDSPRRYRILYAAIKVAWSDNVYAAEERDASKTAGRKLSVTRPMIVAIEGQIRIERGLTHALHDLFHA